MISSNQGVKFSHECPEWDFMEINERDMEFLACSCFDDPEAKAASEAHQLELDEYNRSKE